MNEDMEYSRVDDFAVPDAKKQEDPDQAYKPQLKEAVDYLEQEIKNLDTHSVLDMSEKEATLKEQVGIAKGIIVRLNHAKTILENKLKELR